MRRLRAALRLAADSADSVRGRLLISLAWAESERGRVDLGFRLLDEAEGLLPADGRPLLHAQRAVLLRRNGRNELAEPEFDRAIERLTGPLDLVKALNNRSLLHLDAGRVGAARDDLVRGRRLARQHDLELVGAVLEVNLGCLHVVSGDLPAALGAFAAAQPVYERIAPGRRAALDVERARALVAAGLFRQADRCLAQALAQAAAQGQDHTRADALQVRAEAALLAGRPGAAAEWAAAAGADFRRRGNQRRAALADLLTLRAAAEPPIARIRRLGVTLKRLGLAEDARVAALVAARTGGGPITPPGRRDRLDTRLLWRLTRAELARAAGHPQQAERELAAGMATLARHRARFGSLDLQTGASAHGRDLARAGLAGALDGGRFAAVFRWSERVRAQALRLPAVRPPADPEFAAALEDLRQTRHALRQAELAGRRPPPALRARAGTLHRTIREAAWSMPGAAPRAARVATPGTVRAALGEAALIAYLDTGDRLHALVLTRTTATIRPLGDRRAAEEAVLRLRADLDTAAGRAMPGRLAGSVAAATRADARALAAIVLEPLRPVVGDRDLIVVPTGLLATTPWAVLTDRPVTVAPSATAWLGARARERASARTVLVAGPGNRRGPAEIRAIAGRRPGATVLVGDAATPAATLAAMDGAGIAHLATHGRHEAQNALFSSLELAGGPILGYDLQRLARPPALVVLAACELALSEVRPGDETFGMASALLAAGTATVVASVSRVADDATGEAMIALHRELAAGRDPAEAVAAAAAGTGFVCLGS